MKHRSAHTYETLAAALPPDRKLIRRRRPPASLRRLLRDLSTRLPDHGGSQVAPAMVISGPATNR